jgi:hypothetical protein
MNRRKKMIAYRRSPRYLHGMMLAGLFGALNQLIGVE